MTFNSMRANTQTEKENFIGESSNKSISFVFMNHIYSFGNFPAKKISSICDLLNKTVHKIRLTLIGLQNNIPNANLIAKMSDVFRFFVCRPSSNETKKNCWLLLDNFGHCLPVVLINLFICWWWWWSWYSTQELKCVRVYRKYDFCDTFA